MLFIVFPAMLNEVRLLFTMYQTKIDVFAQKLLSLRVKMI